ncbi:MAG: hypothetical protein ACPGKS_09750 [Coraliomargarita sp.]
MPDPNPPKLRLKPEPQTSCDSEASNRSERPPRNNFWGLLAGITLLSLGFIAFYWANGARGFEDVQSALDEAAKEITFISEGPLSSLNEILGRQPQNEPIRLPANGTEFTYFQGRGFGPITIYNRSSDEHSLIKIESFETGKPVAKYFVRAGDEIQKSLPPGRYRLKFASGMEWYGEPYLFGPKTTVTTATWDIAVTKSETFYSISPSEIEINIKAPIWSKEHAQSRDLDPKLW